ncbi:MAG: disulfide oxidoreductase [Magnetovibrio sp.]|nr:disulfide oxidoreductase [Magnetovibrio sp.]|tara:strand:+ start:326 stop:2923 length:2598 start_codon:yes stop_codon:yes gene_type:complete
MQFNSGYNRITAILGATNTGKTHFAMERMLAHNSGMIGFPLRLLARENYDRAVKIKGKNQVALITGEEKIIPSTARYFLCTTEAMPANRKVAFLGLDEVQMCADPDRGHVFTERLLSARGTFETMLMGADTIKPLIRKLIPEVNFFKRPRLSKLTYTGPHKLARLPRRSAVVAFTSNDVYAMAELIRRHRGGAAVIMGALSPRTRNAQVELYQSGEVDYLVATDAIGMGLNMDVDHVAFAQVRKFDGQQYRVLLPAELAQIAGRAGRYMNDGTFGTTAALSELDENHVHNIEEHNFPPLKKIFWRNNRLSFRSVDHLRRSLNVLPKKWQLTRARRAEDETYLDLLCGNAEVTSLASSPDGVRLLWDVCRIPDFRKLASDTHAELLTEIYQFLQGPKGRLPTDWLAQQIERLNRTDGDIEGLTQRIANIRIWTYVAFRGDWMSDPGHWQERSREIEDSLSDALHEHLMQRFVDKRTSHLVRSLKENRELIGAVRNNGEVLVEGHPVGWLSGFRFKADHSSDGTAANRAVVRAATQALRPEIQQRVEKFINSPDTSFSLANPEACDYPDVLWNQVPVARLEASNNLLKPKLILLKSDLIDNNYKRSIHRRLQRWLNDYIRQTLSPLFIDTKKLPAGTARGLHFRLTENLGSMARELIKEEVKALDRESRRALRIHGFRIGRETVYAPALLKLRPITLRAILWSVNRGLSLPLKLPKNGRASIRIEESSPPEFLEAIGYRPLGLLAVRVEILERTAAEAWALNEKGQFKEPAQLMNLIGCNADELAEVLKHLGYHRETKGSRKIYRLKRRQTGQTEPKNSYMKSKQTKKLKSKNLGKHYSKQRTSSNYNPDSPFAKLRNLNLNQSDQP